MGSLNAVTPLSRGGDVTAVIAAYQEMHRSATAPGSVNDLNLGAKGPLNQVNPGRGRQMSVGQKQLSVIDKDMFGGDSLHRRGHRDCTPPPVGPLKELARPQTSPEPVQGASLL